MKGISKLILPKKIELLIIKCAKHNLIANKAQEEIELWLSKQGIDVENCGFKDVFFHDIEISNSPQEFINYLKDINNERNN